MKKDRKRGIGLRLFPLILGGYAVFLGFGLIMIGLSEMKEGIGMIRLLIGLGMAFFGLLGIWDGVRDLVRPDKKAETPPVRQFILTDISGIKSSHVEEENTYGEEGDAAPEETDARQDAKAFFLDQLRDERNGRPITYWHRLLVLFGESWHNELKFFSVRDVELAVEGTCEGKYQKVVLEWGWQAVVLLPSIQNDMMVLWCTDHTGKENPRFLAKEGTMTQVKFWMVSYMNSGSFEIDGWADVTDRMEKEKRKGRME